MNNSRMKEVPDTIMCKKRPARGARKYFSKPKKGYRTYGKNKNWRGNSHLTASSKTSKCAESGAPAPDEWETNARSKAPIKVLSLFDGPGTAYFILSKQLGIDVEKYYSSEIDPDALDVQEAQFNDKIIPVGDVTSLGPAKLDSLGQIDLLLDPSGTGLLFFEFVRIRDYLLNKASREGNQIYWLFENVTNMTNFVKCSITRYLQCEPIKMIPASTSRDRYMWGNVPNLAERNMKIPEELVPYQIYLENGRVATFDRLPTITSNQSSQCKGRHQTLPVMHKGKLTLLWTTELEQILGLPKGYTDCGISKSRRNKLLAKAWDVKMLAKALRPLASIFRTL